MTLLNDGYGDPAQPDQHDQSDRAEQDRILASYTRWLHKIANSYLDPGDERHDDLVQEGRIAMWRALSTHDPDKGSLPSWLTQAAKLRMKAFAYSRTQPTGREATRGKREVDVVASVEELLDGGPETILGVSDAIEGVEMAYHHGEIWKALETLSPAQRRYVYSRFWLGLDPASRAPAQKRLRALVPEMSRRYLWWGDHRQVGARDRLVAALAHLQS